MMKNDQPTDGTPAWAHIDLAAVRDNVRTLAEHAPRAEVMAVVKADAYGHGLLPSARAALQGGATWLGTAQMPEAFALRDAGIPAPGQPGGARVMTWLSVPGADYAGALTRDIDLSASHVGTLDEIAAAARATDRVARVHLKVDTGLGRNGAYGDDFRALVERARSIEASGEIRVVGVWSHFVLADAPEHPEVLAQQVRFEDAVRLAESLGCELEVRHLANSAATLTRPAVHYDLVRPGIAVYGLTPVPQIDDTFGLRPAMTMHARLANVKTLPAGQGVSYGHQHVTSAPTRVGLVPLGYADGIPRAATNAGPLQVAPGSPAARRTHIIGRVCMDQFVIDLGADAAEAVGDEVVLWGDPATGAPSAQEWADAVDTISYEIVTRLGCRVPRVYSGLGD